MPTKKSKKATDSYIDQIGTYFAKLPPLPKGAREVIVVITPWLALTFGALGAVTALFGLGVFAFLAPLAVVTGVRNTGLNFVIVLLGLTASILLLASFKGVRKRKEKGWRYIYYSEAVALLANIVTFSGFGILFTVVGFYFLYQIRSYYR